MSTNTIWTADGLEYATDRVGEAAGREEGQTLDGFTEWLASQRFGALDAYYASDRTDMEAFGEAIALLYINHKLHDESVDVTDHATRLESERENVIEPELAGREGV